MTGFEWQEWGFVVFRTTVYGDEARLQEIKQRWYQIIDAQFDEYLVTPGVRAAKQKLRFQ